MDLTAAVISDLNAVESRTKANEASQQWYYRNRERVLARMRDYYKTNQDSIKRRVAKAKAKNPDRVREGQKKYRKENKEKLLEYGRTYYATNKPKYKEAAAKRAATKVAKDMRRNRRNWRYANDPQYRAALAARRIAKRALKATKITARTEARLGCALAEFRLHIERQWMPGMDWTNNTNDGWHIDHKVPLSRFDFKCPLQVKLASHFTNLQPLWASDNMKKGNSFI